MQQPLLSSRKGKILLGSAIGLLAWALVLFLYYGSILETYELKTYDQLCRLKAAGSPAPEEVVLIVVDQGSLEAAQKEGINWPWPRQMYAPILQFCASAGAKAVAFDILFTEPSSYGVEDDQLLAEALKANAQAFLPIFLSRQNRPLPPWEKSLLGRSSLSLKDETGESFSPYLSSLPPVQNLAESARGLGNVAIFPDSDGIYRRVRELTQLVSLFQGSVDDVTKTLLVNGYGREQEGQADLSALTFLHRLGYNPYALTDYLDRMAKEQTGGSKQGIFATHPGMSQRLTAAKSFISQKQWPRKSDPARDRRFRESAG